MTYAWLQQWFNSAAVRAGKPTRRKLADVEHLASFDEFDREVRRRSWRWLIVDGYVILLTTDGRITIGS